MDQRKRAARRWGWVLAIGIADILLAVLAVVLGPVAAAMLVGFIVGMDLIVGGLVLVGLGRHPTVTGVI